MSAPQSSPTSPVAEGDVVAGKYRIERIIGRGGMGVVVRARHLQLDDRVAIKFMSSSAADLPEFVERFAREARASIKIRSEHVVRVFDVDALPSGVPYIVMECLEGLSLARLLRKQGPLSPQIAVDYMVQASEALTAAHALGVVHRDIKPSNLFLTTRLDGTDCIKVLDFGISKFLESSSEDDGDLTGSLSLVGSPNYMAPEQMMAAKTVDQRADIWSFGAMLFKLLSGQTPFESGTLPQVCTAILNSDPKDLRELVPAVPAGLVLVVERCLQKDRARRYQSMAELALALAPFGSDDAQVQSVRIQRVAGLETEGAPSSRRLLDAQLEPTVGPGQTISVREVRPRSGRNRLVTILVAVAAILGVSLWFAWSKLASLSDRLPVDSAPQAAQPPKEMPAELASSSPEPTAVGTELPAASASPEAGVQSKEPKRVRAVRKAAPSKARPSKSPAPPATGTKSGLDLFSDPK